MSVRARILMIKLSEKLEMHPDYAKRIGVEIEFNSNKECNNQRKGE